MSSTSTTLAAPRVATARIVLAFAILYLVWGSTFLAIRIGVHEMPPFLLAAARFGAAGLILYAWMRLRGTPAPSATEWRSSSILGTTLFLIPYGAVFWAEQHVPSGITAVMLAMAPVFITALEIAYLRTRQLSWRLALALAIGVLGVAVLVNSSLAPGEATIDPLGAAVLLLAAAFWSIGSILTRRLPLPASKPLSSAAQMLTGGAQLFVISTVSGEARGFHLSAVSGAAWLAFVYLVVAGSIIAFTTYLWLLQHESPTKVSTYAYVNPIVAVLIGYFLADEPIGPRTAIGTMLILASVIVITTMSSRRSAA